MTSVSRVYRLLRTARGRSIDEVAVVAGLAPARLRQIERGMADLLFVEGGTMAKALDLCQTCLRRYVDAAAERDEREAGRAQPLGEPSRADIVPIRAGAGTADAASRTDAL